MWDLIELAESQGRKMMFAGGETVTGVEELQERLRVNEGWSSEEWGRRCLAVGEELNCHEDVARKSYFSRRSTRILNGPGASPRPADPDYDMSVTHIDVAVDEKDISTSALELIPLVRPDWKDYKNSLKFKVFTDGITNKLIGFYVDGDSKDMVLIRIYGQNTDLLIDRKAETNNFKILESFGYAPKLYATFNNGLAYEFVVGEVVERSCVRSPSVYPLVAKMLAHIHKIKPSTDQTTPEPVLWPRLRHYLSLVPSSYANPDKQFMFEEFFPGGVDQLQKELNYLQSSLEKEQCPVVFCHNDLLLANIIYNNGTVMFIDYEYAAFNYQALDIGNHFAEFAGVSDVDYSYYPDKDFQLEWLSVYLKEWTGSNELDNEMLEKLYRQVNKFALASHFLWAAWALVQSHHSNLDFDFISYANIRIKEYYIKRDIFLKL